MKYNVFGGTLNLAKSINLRERNVLPASLCGAYDRGFGV